MCVLGITNKTEKSEQSIITAKLSVAAATATIERFINVLNYCVCVVVRISIWISD